MTTENSTPTATAETIVSDGGKIDFDTFERTVGVDYKDAPKDEKKGEVDEAEETNDEDSTEEGEVHEDEEDSEEDDQESEDEAEANTKKPSYNAKEITVKTKNGYTKLDDDATILCMVDGVEAELPIKDFRNKLVGEATINQRLGKIASDRENLKKEAESQSQNISAFHGIVSNVLERAKEGDFFSALEGLAEELELDPLETYKGMLKQSVIESKKYAGMTPQQIEYEFNKRKLNKYESQEKQQKEIAEQSKIANTKYEIFVGNYKAVGLTDEEMNLVADKLKGTQDFDSLTVDEKLNLTLREAIIEKKVSLIGGGIDKINPNLRQDVTLLEFLDKNVDIQTMSVDDIAFIVKSYMDAESKQVGQSLSKKVNPSQGASKKQIGNKQGSEIVIEKGDLARFLSTL